MVRFFTLHFYQYQIPCPPPRRGCSSRMAHLQEACKLLGYGILRCLKKRHCLSAASSPFFQAPLAKSQSLRVSWPPKPRHPGGTSPARRRARDRPFIKKENSYVTKFKNRKSHRQIPHHPRRNGRRHQPLIPRRCRCQSRRNRRHLRCPARLARSGIRA